MSFTLKAVSIWAFTISLFMLLVADEKQNNDFAVAAGVAVVFLGTYLSIYRTLGLQSIPEDPSEYECEMASPALRDVVKYEKEKFKGQLKWDYRGLLY